jgi:ribosome-associated protein
MNSVQLKKAIISILEEHKAANISAFDVSKITDISDYLIICSATSSRHIKALSDHVIEQVKKRGVMPIGYEGRKGEQGWALIDLGDIIIHIMIPEIREFYNLEKLWNITPNVSKVKPKKEDVMAAKKAKKTKAKKVKKTTRKVAKKCSKKCSKKR